MFYHRRCFEHRAETSLRISINCWSSARTSWIPVRRGPRWRASGDAPGARSAPGRGGSTQIQESRADL
eukprot:4330993-Pyramimonas_sp.AAC.1